MHDTFLLKIVCWVYKCIYLINQNIYYHSFGGIANCEKRLLAAAFLFVCLSICLDLTHWVQVEEILGNSKLVIFQNLSINFKIH
jgi:hypothetical protein